MINCKNLFSEKPPSWSLRGDPFLWEELSDHFAQITVGSSEDFIQQFETAFLKFTGESLVPDKEIFIDRYDPSGMSGGFVSTDYWLDIGLPHLIGRLDRIDSNE